MIHTISENGMTDFTKQMSKLTKRAEKLGLDAVGFRVLSDEIVERKNSMTGVVIGIRMFQVEIFGVSPKLAGWTFIAKIEHGENGNIVLSMSEDTNIDLYRTMQNKCDHCGVSRYRVNTYIIKNDGGEYKQVGSTCLVDFMGHKNAEKIAEFYSSEWFTTSSEEDIDDDFSMGGVSGGKFSLPTKYYVAWVIRAIEKFGWTSTGNASHYHPATKYVAMDMMFDGEYDKMTEQEVENAQALIEKSVEILEGKNKLSDYEWNLLTLIKRDYIKYNHIGFVASVVGFYNRAISFVVELKKEGKLESNYVGEVGGKINNVAVTVIYTNSFDTDYGVSYLYKFVDIAGNQITWFASKNQHLEIGEDVLIEVATVKKQDIYNGEKFTMITRAKIGS